MNPNIFADWLTEVQKKGMTVRDFNVLFQPQYQRAYAFINCMDHALEKCDSDAVRQFECAGWNEQVKTFLNAALESYRNEAKNAIHGIKDAEPPVEREQAPAAPAANSSWRLVGDAIEWAKTLPPVGEEVLVVIQNTRVSPRTKPIVTTAYRNASGMWMGADYNTVIEAETYHPGAKSHFVVTKWMPLPGADVDVPFAVSDGD